MLEDRGRLRHKCDISRGAARAHQQGEDAVCQGCRKKFQHRDIQGHESNRDLAASLLRAPGYKRLANRRPVLSEGTDPRTDN